MKFAIYACNVGPMADIRLLARLATAAEDAGFDGFFISDWMLPSGWTPDRPPVADVQVALTAIALATTTLRMGAMVSPLPRRRPVKFAREVLSLDRLSAGRLIIGAGSGHEHQNEFTQLGEDSNAMVRADKLDETLNVLDGLLRGEEVNLDGDFVHVSHTRLTDPRAQLPRVPIWIGALPDRPRTLRRAARWDGVFALRSDFSLMSPREVAEMRAYIESFRQSGDPYEIAVTPRFPDNQPSPDPAVIAEYEEAGTTWWLEYAWTPEQARDLIARGRPGY